MVVRSRLAWVQGDFGLESSGSLRLLLSVALALSDSGARWLQLSLAPGLSALADFLLNLASLAVLVATHWLVMDLAAIDAVAFIGSIGQLAPSRFLSLVQ